MDWIKDKLFGWIGNKLSGKKTYFAGAGFIMLALVGCLGKMFPDSGLMEMSWDEISGFLAAGCTAFGLGHKAEKILAQGSTVSK